MTEMAPGTELRFALKIGNGELRFIQRPVTTRPKEGTIGFLDGLSEKGNPCRAAGIFKDGEWRGGAGGQKLRFQPLRWTVCADMDVSAGSLVDVG